MARHYRNIGLQNPDGSGRGEKRHVEATVSRLFPDRASHDGAEHQHLWIDDLQALDDGADYSGNVFVAIRVTDGGIGTDIPFEVGKPVELQGLFIPADQAEPGQDNEGLPVLHFTHRPMGFVRYDGEQYE
ncbi:hypothetical protein [Rhodopila sp.]|uniref:hypothetical protein n=1 Tax=Rhodopila sp. TaxID=2480087 RepID=UPI003D149259